jgi:hypothetical protein
MADLFFANVLQVFFQVFFAKSKSMCFFSSRELQKLDIFESFNLSFHPRKSISFFKKTLTRWIMLKIGSQI